MSKINYSILVNTCDKFEDCWDPFFKLFSIYWPNYTGKIYLNTEYKDYSYDGLNIIPLKVCKDNNDAHLITWSECLQRAIQKIDDDIILYMQEDYFLKDCVSDSIINEFVELMLSHSKIHCIHLTDQAVIPEEKSTEFTKLFKVKLKQRYRISCQAALWKKEVLASYIRVYENAWQFEEFGSIRAYYMNHNFYVVDNRWVKLDVFEIIPYIFTGIVQGRWYEKVIPLFQNHHISIEYSRRGFLNDVPKRSFKLKLQYRLERIPTLLKHYIDIQNLKKKAIPPNIN